jgi:surfeit locus 1 family protein
MSLVAIPAILILFALGGWQIQRLGWKNHEQALRNERLAEAPVALPETIDSIEASRFRPIFVEGSFRHEQEMLLAARTFEGALGFQVITPLVRASGQVVLINRGWIPVERKDPASRAEGQVSGPLRIEGLLVPGGQEHWFSPHNHPEQRIWYWAELASLAASAGIPTPNFLVDAGKAPNPGGYPVGGQTLVELRNQHFQYAVIWLCLGVGLSAIYVIYMRRAKTGGRSASGSS